MFIQQLSVVFYEFTVLLYQLDNFGEMVADHRQRLYSIFNAAKRFLVTHLVHT